MEVIWDAQMRQWSCCVSLEKAYHLIWPGTYWLLLSISRELLLQASCAAQHHVCFHLGKHMQLMAMCWKVVQAYWCHSFALQVVVLSICDFGEFCSRTLVKHLDLREFMPPPCSSANNTNCPNSFYRLWPHSLCKGTLCGPSRVSCSPFSVNCIWIVSKLENSPLSPLFV